MKHHLFPRFAGLAACALLLGGALAPVEAQARTRSTTAHGPRGGHYQRQLTQSPGSFSASRSATLPNGKSASRSVTSQRTETGRTTSAQATGLNGQSAKFDSTTTRTDTGYMRQATATGPQGSTASKQVTVAKENGVVTRTVTTAVTPQP